VPKLITDNPKSRRELAAEHLARLRERAGELDAKGAALMAERDALPERIAVAALDAIEDRERAPALIALRARAAELPGLIGAVAAERDALDGEIREAEAALERGAAEEAAATVAALLPERERLAAEIDRLLAKLATAWTGYHDAGKDLRTALGSLGFADPGQAAAYDRIALCQAVQRADPALAHAVATSFAWPDPSSMAEGCDSAKIREQIAATLARAA
jgi:hypothetical protein